MTLAAQIADMSSGMDYNDLDWTPQYVDGYGGIEHGAGNRGRLLDMVGARPQNPPTIGPVEYLPGVRQNATSRPAALARTRPARTA